MKTTIEFDYNIGDKVWINELQSWAHVISLWASDRGNQYEVAWFHNGERKTGYLLKEELSANKP